jgi:plasmid maintenance system antidote protein VapI
MTGVAMSRSGKKVGTMAEVLKDAIEASGQSVAAVARGAGIPQPVLHRFVVGERDLTLRTAEKLVTYFQLELRPARRKKG